MIACFTGHRPPRLGGYNENNLTAIYVKNALREVILALHKQGVDTWITGGALGTDTWAAEIVQELRDSLGWPDKHILARPYPMHGRDGYWPKSSEDRYLAIMSKANWIHTVCDNPVHINTALILRNHWMVNNSQITIAVWNGAQNGGTFECVQYSNMRGNRLVRINPYTRTISGL